ncbi:MAG: hypothetical protein R3204_02695, partial [Oceanospirillum sp.]|nr:hypothetical protein [Oceanospirillum sp.]
MKLMRQGISLQWLIGGAMFSAMFLLSVLLVFQNYQNNKDALLLATTESAKQLSVTLNEKAQRLTGPAQSALQILSYDPLLHASDLPERLSRLPVLFETLDSNDVLSAIYAGYENGEFFLLRKLNNPLLILKFDAPEDSAYLLQTLTQNQNGLDKEWFYYDKNQQLLKREVRPDYTYDPRTRPWYQSSSSQDGQILTNPYLFYTTKEIGITLAIKGNGSTNIIGMDASVGDLSAQISSLKLTKGSQLAIIDDKSQILAHSDHQQIIVQEDKYYRLNTLNELESPVLRITAQNSESADKLVSFSSEDQSWYGISMPLTGLKGHNIQVLLALPADELLAGAKQVILTQTFWTLLVILFLLALGLYSGSRIGTAFRQLTDQVRAL